ncbi:MAG: YbaB/EbfC family nucleoid-associated protein [Alphaproteobacteria bacterium]|nr:YbaB/EbfC family nucleoid-associated protein [Alphaproteobacteria bacterium]
MMNLSALMKQAQEMKKQLEKLDEELAAKTVEGIAGGGLVKVVLNGKGDMISIAIDPEQINPDEKVILEDLIVAAHAKAKEKLGDQSAHGLKNLTSGLSLPPGLKLPF